MAYNRRDLIGHWVKKEEPTQRMCEHACCRGKRVHPKNYPVILPSKLLRRASDDDLAQGYIDGNEKRQAQILHEMERRDRVDAKRRENAAGAKERRRNREYEHYEEIDRVWLEAEAATNGNFLNAKGKAAGISDRYLMTAPERDVRRYGSDELLNYFQDNPRPTTAHMRGKDTRLGTVYTKQRPRFQVVERHPIRAAYQKRAA